MVSAHSTADRADTRRLSVVAQSHTPFPSFFDNETRMSPWPAALTLVGASSELITTCSPAMAREKSASATGFSNSK